MKLYIVGFSPFTVIQPLFSLIEKEKYRIQKLEYGNSPGYLFKKFMSFIDVHIHSVWSTKNRESLLEKNIRESLFDHILYNASGKKIFIDCIGGYTDHLHTLISMSADLSISKTIQLIKGESSHWMNREKLFKTKFEWQDEYFAVSVSPDRMDKVRSYIANQEEHHRSQTFQEEVDGLFKHCGMKLIKG